MVGEVSGGEAEGPPGGCGGLRVVSSMFREAVAASSSRLKAGEKPSEVECPKCHQPRAIALEVIGKGTTTAACAICGFGWVVV